MNFGIFWVKGGSTRHYLKSKDLEQLRSHLVEYSGAALTAFLGFQAFKKVQQLT